MKKINSYKKFFEIDLENFLKIEFILKKLITILFVLFFLFFFYQFKDTSCASDDFCELASVEKNGVLGHVISSYNGWSGRYSYYFLIALFFQIPKFLQGIVLAVFFILNFIVLKKIVDILFSNSNSNDKRFIFFVFSFIFFLLILMDNSYYSLIFNPVLNFTYFFPLFFIFLMVYFLIIKKFKINFFNLLLLFFLGFFLSGFQENLMLILNFIFLIFNLYVFLLRNKETSFEFKARLFFIFLGLLVGGIVMYLAPGNNVRGSYFLKMSFYQSMLQAFNLILNDIKTFNYFNNFILNIIYIFSILVFFDFKSKIKNVDFIKKKLEIILISSFFIGVFLRFLTYFQGFFSIGSILGGRQITYLNYYEFFLSFLIAFLFYLIIIEKIDNYLSFRFFVILLLISIGIFKFLNFWQFVKGLNFYSTYEKKIFSLKQNNLNKLNIILPDHPFQLEQIINKSDHWSFKCLKNYLRVKNLKLEKIKN